MKDDSTKQHIGASLPRPQVSGDIPEIIRENYDLVVVPDSEYTATPGLDTPAYGLSLERPDIPSRDAQTNVLLAFACIGVSPRSGKEYRALFDYRGLSQPSLGDLLRRTMAGLEMSESVLRNQDQKNLLRVLVAWHWGSAEMGMLEDYKGLKGLMAHQEVKDMGGAIISLAPFEYHFNLRDGHDNQGRVMLTFRDTRCLMDADKGALDAIGESIGLKKIDIEAQGYSKARMDVLMEKDFSLFTQYAMRDVEIVKHWVWTQSRIQRELGMDNLSPTIGHGVASGLRQFLGKTFQDLFAVRYNKYAKEWRPTRIRAWDESFAVECFMGGANQTYQLGDAYGTIMDIDISGAYSGAMGAIRSHDYEQSHQGGPRNPWDLIGPQDFALVTFVFPEDTQYPCLPVPSDHGLIFPRSCWIKEKVSEDCVGVTGPELHEALKMGAIVRVYKHYKAVTGDLLIAPYLRYLTNYRADCKKRGDGPGDKVAKLYINSLYGKFGQGLSRTYSLEELQNSDEVTPEDVENHVGRCCITEPRIAATITGIIRAVLNVLVREASKLGTVLSATTDGLMLCLPRGTDTHQVLNTLMDQAAAFPSVQLMLEGRAAVGVTGPWLEDKHPGGTHAHTIKTRTNAIFNDTGDILTEPKVGFPKDTGRDDYIPYTQLIEVLESGGLAYYTGTRLNTITDVIEGRAKAITSYALTKVVNVAPDWKRRFAPDGSSQPFASMREFWQYRRVVEDLGPGAFVDAVQERIEGRRIPSAPRSLEDAEKQILWRIAHRRPGYRLGKGINEKTACQRIGVNEKALQRLRNEKARLKDLPGHAEKYEDYRRKLNLW
jgi:hypothetical protein